MEHNEKEKRNPRENGGSVPTGKEQAWGK